MGVCDEPDRLGSGNFGEGESSNATPTSKLVSWRSVRASLPGRGRLSKSQKSRNDARAVETHAHRTAFKQYRGLVDQWDAIVIGSGIGGPSVAATLSKLADKRVLVLERHYTAWLRGPVTHSVVR